MMERSPAYLLWAYLIADDYLDRPFEGTWPCFLGFSPSLLEKSNSCCIVDTTPIKDGRIQRTGEVCNHYGVQLLVRSVEYELGWSKSDSLQRVIASIHNQNVTAGVASYRIVNATKASVGYLGRDERRLCLFTMNFVLTLEKLI